MLGTFFMIGTSTMPDYKEQFCSNCGKYRDKSKFRAIKDAKGRPRHLCGGCADARDEEAAKKAGK